MPGRPLTLDQVPVAGPAAPDRRGFLKAAAAAVPTVLLGLGQGSEAGTQQEEGPVPYDSRQHYYGMGIDVNKCIGCGRCVEACAAENDVPRDGHHFRTWVERYVITADGEAVVESPNGGIEGFSGEVGEHDALRTFFVPKLCNHCANPPCVQVCPVGATFTTEDGVVLVDEDWCIGCRYCIQACPYGARFLHPTRRVAQKCTFCYHRIVQGLLPACVEVCPTGARIFGEVQRLSTPLGRFMRFNEIQVLKPYLNTKPKVFYANLDGEVR
ncbi:MAG: 4Fe-4S dicluster domain-containing protein [Gemmatimonadales bacterium]|nr:4Fe-4S dicluster domain-containing protein [Gemmatimonadales bacterium]